MSNPNAELIEADHDSYQEWLNECLDPEDARANADGYWDENDEFHEWDEENDETLTPGNTWRDGERLYR